MSDPMETADFNPATPSDPSRPALGFPLGTALLLIVIFCVCGAFSCCFHWDKFRSIRRFFSGGNSSFQIVDAPPSKPSPAPQVPKQDYGSSLRVLMPGDNVPKFIALPCPSEPSRGEHLVLEAEGQNQSSKPHRTPPIA